MKKVFEECGSHQRYQMQWEIQFEEDWELTIGFENCESEHCQCCGGDESPDE